MKYTIEELFALMVSKGASDMHLTVGVPPVLRQDGNLVKLDDKILTAKDIDECIIALLDPSELEKFIDNKELDICISRPAIGRFRLNIFKQRGSSAIAARNINSEIASLDQLGLPQNIEDIAKKTRGLFLVTGPTGSGKTTTLASIVDLINRERKCHIITLEDPIEYLHRHKSSIVNQREIGPDSKSYASALRAALREDPDVILIGEMRDLETISIALTAAETGHLVLSTLHTVGATRTIDRITDVFPPHQQHQIRIQLSSVLIGVLSQVLLPRVDEEGRVLVYELMFANNAIRNLIRESKTYQILSVMQTNLKAGMMTMDRQLVELLQNGVITTEDVLTYAEDPDFIAKSLQTL